MLNVTESRVVYLRKNNRLDNQIRPISMELGVLNRADGSVRYAHDGTSVLVAVHGPIAVRSRQELIDRACVEVVYKSLHGNNFSRIDVEKAAFIRQTLESCIIVKLHPRTKISIIIQIIKDDGSVVATAINGACLSLLNAGIAMQRMVASVCVCMISSKIGNSETNNNMIVDNDKDDKMTDGDRVRIILDPDQREEQLSQSILTLVIATDNSKDSVTPAIDSKGVSHFVIASQSNGMLTEDQHARCIETAQNGAATIFTFFRMSLTKKLERDFKLYGNP